MSIFNFLKKIIILVNVDVLVKKIIKKVVVPINHLKKFLLLKF